MKIIEEFSNRINSEPKSDTFEFTQGKKHFGNLQIRNPSLNKTLLARLNLNEDKVTAYITDSNYGMNYGKKKVRSTLSELGLPPGRLRFSSFEFQDDEEITMVSGDTFIVDAAVVDPPNIGTSVHLDGSLEYFAYNSKTISCGGRKCNIEHDVTVVDSMTTTCEGGNEPSDYLEIQID